MSLPNLSLTDIANRVFTRVGINTITNVEGSQNQNAILFTSLYPQIRDQVLREHFWPFATKKSALELETEKPLYGFANAFSLPPEFVRLKDTSLDNTFPYEIERNRLLTDAESVSITFVANDITITEWDILFFEALVVRLAFELVTALNKNEEQKAALFAEYQQKIKDARYIPSTEQNNPEPIFRNTITRAGGYRRRRRFL